MVNMSKRQKDNDTDNQPPCVEQAGPEGRPHYGSITGHSSPTQSTVDGLAPNSPASLRTEVGNVEPSDRGFSRTGASKHSGITTRESHVIDRPDAAANEAADINASIATTAQLRANKEAVREFLEEESLSRAYDSERDFGVFNHVALDPMAFVAVDSALGSISPDWDKFVRQSSGLSCDFISYKARLEDVTRPDGSYGRVMCGMHEAVVIYKVSASTTPLALKALREVQLPIIAIVCDLEEGLEIWVKADWESWSSYSDAQYSVMHTMRDAGIDGIITEPQSRWMIPGSFPMGSSYSKANRRRLLFACRDPHELGMAGSINDLSYALY
jgi:hypothetical protein